MKLIKLWWLILKTFRTPLFIPLDMKHEPVTEDKLRQFFLSMPPMSYRAEYQDCDNFAMVYKGIADRETNAVGLVFGWCHGWHLWNMAITENAVVQIEPQNGSVFTESKDYRPIIIFV